MSGLLAILILVGAQSEKTHPGFERLKKLAGDWEMKGVDGVAIRYRVTAGGSAVLETFFPESDDEMVSLYTMEDGKLKMTHYCTHGNQPTLREEKSGEKSIRMVCDGKVGGAKSHDDLHMHALTVTFVDDNHLCHEWTSVGGGKEHEVTKFEFTRKK